MVGWIVAFAFGILLFLIGIKETQLYSKSAAEPTDYALAGLEKGAGIDNAHARIGEHYALYPAMVYQVETRNRNEEPRPDDRVDQIWYPIISAEHPAFKEIAAGEAPSYMDFAVIVGEDFHGRVSELPSGVVKVRSMQGLVISDVHKLRSGVRKLLEESFPGVDMSRVAVLDAGRNRASITSLLIIYGAGLGVMGFAVYYGFLPRMRKAREKTTVVQQES